MSTTTTSTADTSGSEQIDLLVTGFRSFSDVNLIHKAVSRLPGVSQVQPRALGAGGMHFVVSYSGIVPFEVHLAELLRSRGRALPAHIQLATA
jgi:hypothetical protein